MREKKSFGLGSRTYQTALSSAPPQMSAIHKSILREAVRRLARPWLLGSYMADPCQSTEEGRARAGWMKALPGSRDIHRRSPEDLRLPEVPTVVPGMLVWLVCWYSTTGTCFGCKQPTQQRDLSPTQQRETLQPLATANFKLARGVEEGVGQGVR